MPRVLYGQDEAVAAWVCSLIPHVGPNGIPGPNAALGVVGDSGRPLAGIIYHDYHPAYSVIQLTFASVSPMWARRDVIRELLAYPFQQLGCFKVWTATPIDNEAAIKVNLHLGFVREAVLAHQFGKNRHCVICRMTLPIFNRRYNGQEINSISAGAA